MKSIKSALVILSAVLLGAVLGIFLSRPPQVKAALSGLRVQKVTEGYNTVQGSQVLGFSCTQENCYIATTAQ
jgi:hypothetical protein